MLHISDSGQVLPLQGATKVEDDTLTMDHHCLLADNYYCTTLLVERAVEVLCLLLQAKLSGLALVEGQWRAHID